MSKVFLQSGDLAVREGGTRGQQRSRGPGQGAGASFQKGLSPQSLRTGKSVLDGAGNPEASISQSCSRHR